jgi:phytoene dehydrogenase-like protein
VNRVIIIGAGHNGLVAAFYLARAGLKPLVLERRAIVGGACVTEEFHPGFRASLANSAGPLLPQVINDLQLQRHGLEFIDSPVRVAALNLDGPPLCIYEDAKRSAGELAVHSRKDSEKYSEFVSCFANIGRTLRPLVTMTPPNIDAPSKSELWNLGKLGWKIRGLGRKDEYRLLRYGPMAVADLAAEWFENELLRAIVAARGVFGAFAGPWSAGTTAPLLLQAAMDGHALAPAAFVKGGMGALTQALAKAASEAGAEIRTNTEVANIQTENGYATGVVLATGEEISGHGVISNADPKSTFLKLVDATELDPGFIQKVRNLRAHGAVAKVNLALSALPKFRGLGDDDAEEKLSGRIHVGRDIDYLERAFDAAKYGDFSPSPYMDITIPSLTDPLLAPKGAQVMSIHVQFAPYKLKDGDWNSRREELGDAVVKVLSDYAPNLKESIVARQVVTPLDLEQTYGLSGGHIHHGEMSLDQLFAFRPLIGWARYRTPIKGLYLCGAGTHPGGGVTGACGFNASREIIKDLRSSR